MRRIFLAVAGGAAWACLTSTGSALGAGATFEVVQCDPLNRANTADAAGSSAYVTRDHCVEPSGDFALKIENARAASPGQGRRFVWVVPNGLGLVGVRVQARLQRHEGHIPRLYMADETGEQTERIATGDADGEGFRTFTWDGASQQRFVASLACEGNDRCQESDRAKTWIRNVRLEVVDLVDPEVEVVGELFGAGWLRGIKTAGIQVTDPGSGVATFKLQATGVIRAANTACPGSIFGTAASRLFLACSQSSSLSTIVDTRAVELQDGENVVAACSTDFAGNEACLTRQVLIDNAPPQLAFRDQAEDDPELLRVAAIDEHSGLASGVISFRQAGTDPWRTLPTSTTAGGLEARVDSAAEAPGAYEFRVVATDVAGNSAESTSGQGGLPKTLQFPLRSGVELSTNLQPGGAQNQTVRYGRSLVSSGRLRAAAGDPLEGEPVVVDEYFGEGALIDHRVRTVITDENGRWESKNPAGPTRTITATYAGDQRYLGTTERVGRMSVKTGARFGVSRRRVREGRKVVFRGKIGHVGARIPDRGKLIQLQYQDADSRRWSTVRNPFYTSPRGRYRFAYEFGTHYASDVRIRFRLRVLPEQNWPYRSVNTRARRVVVEAG